MSDLSGVKEALEYAKKKNGRQASEVRRTLSDSFNLSPALTRVMYQSDLVKMGGSGRALYSEPGVPSSASRERIKSALTKVFMSSERLKRLVTVYGRQDEARAAGTLSQNFKGRAKGWVMGGRVYLVAENIPAGHELGAHFRPT